MAIVQGEHVASGATVLAPYNKWRVDQVERILISLEKPKNQMRFSFWEFVVLASTSCRNCWAAQCGYI